MINCAIARNEARKAALKTKANLFMFLDDDIVLPAGSLAQMALHSFPVIRGYYPLRGPFPRYSGGCWVADNTFQHFPHIMSAGLVKSDLVGMGWVLIRRDVLEQIEFEPGIDTELQDTHGNNLILDESGAFSNACLDLDIPLFLDGHCVCNHIGIKDNKPTKQPNEKDTNEPPMLQPSQCN
jgi:hypothetical protein